MMIAHCCVNSILSLQLKTFLRASENLRVGSFRSKSEVNGFQNSPNKPKRLKKLLNDEGSQRDALEKFGKEELGVKELDDWYSIDSSKITRELKWIKKLHGSFFKALQNLYPHHNWNPLLFSKLPPKFWNDEDVQKSALERLGIEIGVKELDDWYYINPVDVQNRLKFIKSHYNSSLFNALKHLYPNHEWKPLQLERFQHSHWKDLDVQRDALERFGREKLGVKELNDWYKVTPSDVIGSLKFIKHMYRGSLFDALKTLYPHHNWDLLKFPRVPKGYWNDESTQRDALERLGRELGVKELDDWYSVDATDVINELAFIHEHYNNSLFNALKKLFPHHRWDPLRLSRVPQRFWNDENAQREALDRLGKELGVKELDDWYSVHSAVAVNELSFIKKHYKGSLTNALMHLYPHHNWNPLKFSTPHKGYWKDLDVQRAALEKFGREKLGVKKLDDWYTVDISKCKRQLSFIHVYYKGPFINVLKTLYPQHDWDPLRFVRLPLGHWKQPDTQQHYYRMLSSWKSEHNIQRASDWYSLPLQRLEVFKRVSKALFGSTQNLLSKWFPSAGVKEIQFTSQLELQMILNKIISDKRRTKRYIAIPYSAAASIDTRVDK